MKFAEAFVASLGILIFGWVSIPATAWLVGASVTVQQGAEMGLIFFALRLVWLYVVRRYFESAWLCVTRSFLNWRRRCS